MPGKDGLTASTHQNPVWRPLETVTVNRSISAFPGLVVVGELDDTLKLPLEVTMTEDWSGYLNAHVMMEVGNYYGGRVTHWCFVPDTANAQIIFLKAESEKEYGATEVKHLETESGARINLRRPMQQLGVQRHPDRVWSFPLVVRMGTDGKEYIAITLKGATTRPVQTRKSKAVAAAPVAGSSQGTAPADNGGATAPSAGPGVPGIEIGTVTPATVPSANPGTPAASVGGEIATAEQPAAGTKASPPQAQAQGQSPGQAQAHSPAQGPVQGQGQSPASAPDKPSRGRTN